MDRERALEWVKKLGLNWQVGRNVNTSVVYNCAAIGSATSHINNINADSVLDERDEFDGIDSDPSDEPTMDTDTDIDTETDTRKSLHDSTDDDYQLPVQAHCAKSLLCAATPIGFQWRVTKIWTTFCVDPEWLWVLHSQVG